MQQRDAWIGVDLCVSRAGEKCRERLSKRRRRQQRSTVHRTRWPGLSVGWGKAVTLVFGVDGTTTHVREGRGPWVRQPQVSVETAVVRAVEAAACLPAA